MTMQDLPHIDAEALETPSLERLGLPGDARHPPRILILYGSLRPQSFSRKLALEAERILQQLGAETRVFDPHELPLLDSVPADHPKVQELRASRCGPKGRYGSVPSGTAR